MGFDKYIQSCSHNHSKDTEHFHYSTGIPQASFPSVYFLYLNLLIAADPAVCPSQ